MIPNGSEARSLTGARLRALEGTLEEYHLAHAARADLCRCPGRADEARAAYERGAGAGEGARAALPAGPDAL